MMRRTARSGESQDGKETLMDENPVDPPQVR